jgi:hypothetical protein
MKLKSSWILKSSFIASVLTVVGWGASQFAQNQSTFGGVCAIVRLLLLLPGGFIVVGLSMAFSPQGIHGGDSYDWVMAPASWLIYFLICAAIFQRKRRMANASNLPM